MDGIPRTPKDNPEVAHVVDGINEVRNNGDYVSDFQLSFLNMI